MRPSLHPKEIALPEVMVPLSDLLIGEKPTPSSPSTAQPTFAIRKSKTASSTPTSTSSTAGSPSTTNIGRSHCKELRLLLSRKKAIILNRCRVRTKSP